MELRAPTNRMLMTDVRSSVDRVSNFVEMAGVDWCRNVLFPKANSTFLIF